MTMKIIFISDLHNAFDALQLLPKADLLVVGGDFTQLGSQEEVLAAIKRVENAAIAPTFLAVGGNMDCPNADQVIATTGHALTLENTVAIRHLRLRGVGGGNTSPFNTPFEWSDQEMAPKLAAIPAEEINIFVSHAPAFKSGADAIPSGLNVGSQAIAQFLQQNQVPLALCGHIHEAKGIYEFGHTTVVNPGPFGEDGNYAEIIFPAEGAPQVRLDACR